MPSFTELALDKLDTAFSKVNRNHRLTLARQKLMRRWPKRWLRILYKDLNIVMESNNSNNKIIKDGTINVSLSSISTFTSTNINKRGDQVMDNAKHISFNPAVLSSDVERSGDLNLEFIDSDLAQSIVSDTVKAGKY